MVTPEEAVQVIHESGGSHAGYRALHAKGSLFRGTFTATAAAKALSRAVHLDGRTVPALVRFSNGAPEPDKSDNRPMIRGMAVKLSLPDGSTTDISAQTGRLFISRTPEGFVEFMRASKLGPLAGVKLAKFTAQYPEFLHTLRANAVALKVPASYATIEWHALHAFKWIDADGGSRFVRYHWIPEAGIQHLKLLETRSKSPDYLTEELTTRLAEVPVRFELHVQVAGPDDSTVDPSAPWASDETTAVGTLEITGIDTEREHEGDIVVFDPMRVTDGIEASDDPVLHFRSLAYSVSVQERSGVGRGAEAPPA
ncbi:catalase [Antrihabitans sp. YC2-6]|uniref:catalase n=1 Tax=Antrihabitans sp. YC2-6 TaxID=2799498 RepID=UPI0018F57A3A|nr:catalase [Antrihabitans sp. YC2-6]MBJ8348177.1 catalase [Antrihabitans sp. YC2-6]